MKVVLHQFFRTGDFPNDSPFCMKLETYMRMASIDYQLKIIKNPKKAPNGKVPFVEVNGEVMGDSSAIIEYFENTIQNPVDSHLTDEQNALSVSVQRMLEEHYYWGIVYSRWLDKVGYKYWIGLSKKLVSPMMTLIYRFLVKPDVKKELYYQGLGRVSQERIYALCSRDLESLSVLLGDKPYFFGEQPSILDAVIYANVASALYTEWNMPLKITALKLKNLVEHEKRMQQRYFPEYNRN